MFKFLTCLFVAVGTSVAFSQVLNQETFKTHLRWSLKTKKENLSIDKNGTVLSLKTLDRELFTKLAGEFAKLDGNKNYFKGFDYKEGSGGAPSELQVFFKDDSVELFSFYKAKDGEHVLDFWINQDLVAVKTAAVQKPKVVRAVAPKPAKKPAPKRAQAKIAKAKVVKKNVPSLDQEINVLNPESVFARKGAPGYRDFRYGAAFVWDYPAFIPPLEREINLAVKAPDYFYQIKDRPFKDGDKQEAHMQLSINFYRKQKWGLMTKSINLYEKEYGAGANRDLNDFMKAVSLIKNVINPKVETSIAKSSPAEGEDGELIEPEINASDKGVLSSALEMLKNVTDRTEDYELKKACMRYILENSLRENDHIGALEMAKQLYVAATGQFDDEMIIRSSRVILRSLAKLKQLDKMEEFLQNKAVIRVLPAQEGDAYIGYVNLVNDRKDQVIARYAANKKSYAKPVHPAILFNTAEAYFRKAEYEKAIALFDEFNANYSFYDVAGFANVRLALGYDLLGKKEDKVLKLYENAINKSSNAKARYEAKVRYVGLRVARKRQLDQKDLETISFLEATPVEKKNLDGDLKKLLWLTRLRTMIVQEKYEDALAYLSATPLNTLRQVERRTFDGDGAEIILGIIKASYLNEDYARAVKVWEVFKDKYESKVAMNPYMNFIVSDSFLKLGLDKSFERSFASLEKMKGQKIRLFPRWVPVHKEIDTADYLKELRLGKLIQSEDWKNAETFLEGVKNEENINYNYYKGLVSYKLKKYNEAVKFFEKLLVKPNVKNILSPRQSLIMLTSYSESLYQGNDQKRFRTNVAALLNDLRRSGKKRSKAVERLEYLYIESLNGEKKASYDLVDMKTKEFLAAHRGSVYTDRIKYLRGVALIKISNAEEGKKLLEELINGQNVPEYLKGLARSELSSLVLKNKTL